MTSDPVQFLPTPPLDLLNVASLFLDFDGTLVELASRHDAVTVEAELHALIAALLLRLQGRLAIVSGRPASEIRKLFGEPIFLISGSHGTEFHWPDGRVSAPPEYEFAPAMVARLDALAAERPGVFVERKPFGVAVHYRLAPECEKACIALAEQIAKETGLVVQPGKMVIELKFAAAHKGVAVERLMQEEPMRAGRPIFIGDDMTDEAGFAASARLGGAGVLVGAPRPTAAAYRLANVADTLVWLHSAAKAAP